MDGGLASSHLGVDTLGSGTDAAARSGVRAGLVAGLELTQPTHRRRFKPGQMHDVLGREPLREKPPDRGRGSGLRVCDRLFSGCQLLPGDLHVDRRLVDALLPS
jgi:hypothetical protein